MFSHITLGSNDLDRAARFYDAVLLPLGLRRRIVEPDGGPAALCWIGAQNHPRFYIYTPFDGQPASAGNGTMTAWFAPSQAALDAAYAAGLAAGGSDEGAPGIRAHYAPDYYGAYLRDPDGNKVHLVFRSGLTT